MLCFTLKIWGFTGVWNPLFQIQSSDVHITISDLNYICEKYFTQTGLKWKTDISIGESTLEFGIDVGQGKT